MVRTIVRRRRWLGRASLGRVAIGGVASKPNALAADLLVVQHDVTQHPANCRVAVPGIAPVPRHSPADLKNEKHTERDRGDLRASLDDIAVLENEGLSVKPTAEAH